VDKKIEENILNNARSSYEDVRIDRQEGLIGYQEKLKQNKESELNNKEKY